jgi:dynein intermediate chain
VLKTPLSAAGHTHPVYGMKMVGTQNAHNLITSSTDGMVCSWLADMLAQPHVRPLRYRLAARIDRLC